jgi:hypothetical protein
MIGKYIPERYDDFMDLMEILVRDDELVTTINKLNSELHNSENMLGCSLC